MDEKQQSEVSREENAPQKRPGADERQSFIKS